MILKDGVEELNLMFKFSLDGFDSSAFISSDANMKCFYVAVKQGLLFMPVLKQSDPGISKWLGQDAAKPAGSLPLAAGC